MHPLPLLVGAAAILVAGARPPASPEAMVRGKSGTVWETVAEKVMGEWVYIMVRFHGEPVLGYKQKGSDVRTRTLSITPHGVPGALLAMARKDFGIT